MRLPDTTALIAVTRQIAAKAGQRITELGALL
jgi:hypothetical protein